LGANNNKKNAKGAMDPDLQRKLARRQEAGAEGVVPTATVPTDKPFNPNIEFPEFSRKEIKEYETLFKKHNTSGSGYLDLMELKLMMEQLGTRSLFC
jgi:hypothetical protein